jgi:hypothetical protein
MRTVAACQLAQETAYWRSGKTGERKSPGRAVETGVARRSCAAGQVTAPTFWEVMGTSSVLSRDGRASAASSCSTNSRAYIDPTSTTLTAELMCMIALRQGLDARGEKGNHGLAGRREIIGVELAA